MQTSLAALYEREWLPFRTHEEEEGGEKRKGRGKAVLVKGSGMEKECMCMKGRSAGETQVSVSEHHYFLIKAFALVRSCFAF